MGAGAGTDLAKGTMRVRIRVLTEQEARRDNPDRGYLASGSEVDLPAEWAQELLSRGEAEPLAQTRAARAEKRPANKPKESR